MCPEGIRENKREYLCSDEQRMFSCVGNRLDSDGQEAGVTGVESFILG